MFFIINPCIVLSYNFFLPFIICCHFKVCTYGVIGDNFLLYFAIIRILVKRKLLVLHAITDTLNSDIRLNLLTIIKLSKTYANPPILEFLRWPGLIFCFFLSFFLFLFCFVLFCFFEGSRVVRDPKIELFEPHPLNPPTNPHFWPILWLKNNLLADWGCIAPLHPLDSLATGLPSVPRSRPSCYRNSPAV